MICGTLIVLAIIFKGRKKESDEVESQLIQELHQGLTRMEKRIESLETIILESQKKTSKDKPL